MPFSASSIVPRCTWRAGLSAHRTCVRCRGRATCCGRSHQYCRAHRPPRSSPRLHRAARRTPLRTTRCAGSAGSTELHARQVGSNLVAAAVALTHAPPALPHLLAGAHHAVFISKMPKPHSSQDPDGWRRGGSCEHGVKAALQCESSKSGVFVPPRDRAVLTRRSQDQEIALMKFWSSVLVPRRCLGRVCPLLPTCCLSAAVFSFSTDEPRPRAAAQLRGRATGRCQRKCGRMVGLWAGRLANCRVLIAGDRRQSQAIAV